MSASTTSTKNNNDRGGENRNGPGKKTSKNLFFSGVVLLTATNLINKVIGLLFRIPITNLLHDAGMAPFNAAYHIYTWFYMISTAGLPIAVALMISEARVCGDEKVIKRIYKVALTMFLIVGAVGTALMCALCQTFEFLNQVEGSHLSLIAIAPTLFFVCVSSAMRGFFQGYQNMFPTSVSQVLESLGKLVLGLLFANYAISRGYSLYVQAAFAIAGLSIGSFAGMLFLWVCRLRHRDSDYVLDVSAEEREKARKEYGGSSSTTGAIIRRLIVIAIPITISASIMSLTTMVDDGIINWRLQAIGMTREAANTLYGNYTALCVPVANLPPVLIYPISYSIIPLLRAASAAGQRDGAKATVARTLKVTSLIAIPCTLGMSAFAYPILSLIYDAESAQIAAGKLAVLSLSTFFISMLSVSNAVLQAYGKERLPIVSMIVGSAVKLIASFVLIGIPAVGIYGAPISTVLCYIVITVLNFYFMVKYTGVAPSIARQYVRPLLCGVICVAAGLGVKYLFELTGLLGSAKMITLLSILFTAVVYAALIFLLRAVDEDDIRMLPKGDKIFSLLCKVHLMKPKKA